MEYDFYSYEVNKEAFEPLLKATELRLGNWVESYIVYSDGIPPFKTEIKPIQQVQVDYHILKIIESPLATYRPIPLSPEVLEKCGFVKAADNDQFGGYLSPVVGKEKRQLRFTYGEHYTEYPLRESYWSHLIGTGKYYGYDLRVDYLHQLQNLFFSLTGTELNYVV